MNKVNSLRVREEEKAFDEGHLAYFRSESHNSNPYSWHRHEYDAWSAGWLEAQGDE